MHKLSIVRLDEMKNCTIICPNPDCRTEVTMRIDSLRWDLTACPTCSKRFDDANLKKIIGNLRETYSLATKPDTDYRVEFHIKELSDKAGG
jgi:hypothetical protein